VFKIHSSSITKKAKAKNKKQAEQPQTVSQPNLNSERQIPATTPDATEVTLARAAELCPSLQLCEHSGSCGLATNTDGCWGTHPTLASGSSLSPLALLQSQLALRSSSGWIQPALTRGRRCEGTHGPADGRSRLNNLQARDLPEPYPASHLATRDHSQQTQRGCFWCPQ